MKIIAALVFAAAAWGQAYTTISDTLPPGASGKAVNGSANITWTQFTYGAATIAQSPATGYNFPIVNGVVNIPLVATDHSAASVTYKVVVTIGGQAVTTYWSVPTLPSGQCASSSFCTVKEVTVAYPSGANLVINPAQISTTGSTNGEAMCNVNGITGWCAGASGVAWGAITGTLSAQTDLQNALNAKQNSLGFTPLNVASNLSDLASASTARTNLGLGTAATQASSAFQAALGFAPENTANKDGASGYAGLDSGGKLKVAEAPTWNQSTTGNAGTATALAAEGTQCGSGQAPQGVDASGNALNCQAVGGASVISHAPLIDPNDHASASGSSSQTLSELDIGSGSLSTTTGSAIRISFWMQWTETGDAIELIFGTAAVKIVNGGNTAGVSTFVYCDGFVTGVATIKFICNSAFGQNLAAPYVDVTTVVLEFGTFANSTVNVDIKTQTSGTAGVVTLRAFEIEWKN